MKTKFMPYLLAGYPDIESSIEKARILLKYCDILEVGIPHSDPIADGIVIQNAHQMAIKNGFHTKDLFIFLEKLQSNKPIVLLLYFNTILQYGIEEFIISCAKYGVNALLIPDLPPEHRNYIDSLLKQHNIHLVFIISTNTSMERVKFIDEISDYFIYFICKPSITGEKSDIEQETLDFLVKIKTFVKNDIFAGFGISNKMQIEKLSKAGADGVIIGSKLVNLFNQDIENFCKSIF